MKIIKKGVDPGNKEHTTKCCNCSTIFTYQDKELDSIYRTITCPLCKYNFSPTTVRDSIIVILFAIIIISIGLLLTFN